jgi:hypothetical protein
MSLEAMLIFEGDRGVGWYELAPGVVQLGMRIYDLTFLPPFIRGMLATSVNASCVVQIIMNIRSATWTW